MEFKEGLTFDDVLLVPKYSDITSRSQTDLTTKLSRNISINIPFVSANMDTVTESSMAGAMARAGGIGIIHRFLTIKEQASEVLKVKRSGSVMIENPYSISADKSIEYAMDYAHDKEISGLLVVDSNSKLIGIVTERDLLFANKSSKIQDVMTKDVVTAKMGVTLDLVYFCYLIVLFLFIGGNVAVKVIAKMFNINLADKIIKKGEAKG